MRRFQALAGVRPRTPEALPALVPTGWHERATTVVALLDAAPPGWGTSQVAFYRGLAVAVATALPVSLAAAALPDPLPVAASTAGQTGWLAALLLIPLAAAVGAVRWRVATNRVWAAGPLSAAMAAGFDRRSLAELVASCPDLDAFAMAVDGLLQTDAELDAHTAERRPAAPGHLPAGRRRLGPARR